MPQSQSSTRRGDAAQPQTPEQKIVELRREVRRLEHASKRDLEITQRILGAVSATCLIVSMVLPLAILEDPTNPHAQEPRWGLFVELPTSLLGVSTRSPAIGGALAGAMFLYFALLIATAVQVWRSTEGPRKAGVTRLLGWTSALTAAGTVLVYVLAFPLPPTPVLPPAVVSAIIGLVTGWAVALRAPDA